MLPAAFQLIPGMLVRCFDLRRLRSPWSFCFLFSLLSLCPSADLFRLFIRSLPFLAGIRDRVYRRDGAMVLDVGFDSGDRRRHE